MAFVKNILFESPLWLGLFCFALFAVVLFARQRLEGPTRAYALPGVLLLTIGLFFMQWLVVTDRERLRGTFDQFLSAVTNKDIPTVKRMIARGYKNEGMGRDEIVRFIDGSLKEIDVYDTRIRQFAVKFKDHRADLTLGVIGTIRVPPGGGEMHTGRWLLGWVLESGEWKLDKIQPLMIDTVEITSLQYLRGLAR